MQQKMSFVSRREQGQIIMCVCTKQSIHACACSKSHLVTTVLCMLGVLVGVNLADPGARSKA